MDLVYFKSGSGTIALSTNNKDTTMKAPTYNAVKRYIRDNIGDFLHYLMTEHSFKKTYEIKSLSMCDKIVLMLDFYCKAHNI